MVVGAPQQVRARLVDLSEAFGVDEVTVLTVCHDLKARLRSYQLLAETFELRPPG